MLNILSEQSKLAGVVPAGCARWNVMGTVMHFKCLEDCLCSVDHGLGQSGQSAYMHAIRPIGASLFDAVQKDDLVLPLLHSNVAIANGLYSIGQVSQLVIVGCE